MYVRMVGGRERGRKRRELMVGGRERGRKRRERELMGG
jgi:hypothetical protein